LIQRREGKEKKLKQTNRLQPLVKMDRRGPRMVWLTRSLAMSRGKKEKNPKETNV